MSNWRPLTSRRLANVGLGRRLDDAFWQPGLPGVRFSDATSAIEGVLLVRQRGLETGRIALTSSQVPRRVNGLNGLVRPR